MLGLSPFSSVQCPSCKLGRSLRPEEAEQLNKERTAWEIEVQCDCGKAYPYREGIIQDLVSDHLFAEWSFVSDIFLVGTAMIVVGRAEIIPLTHEVPVISKIELTAHTQMPPPALAWIPWSTSSFAIISSAFSGGVPVGEALQVAWLLYGRSIQSGLPVWRNLLVTAKEEILQGQYALAVLTSEIAFESFIDALLSEHLGKRNIPDDAVELILKSTRIYDKLLSCLCGLEFKKAESGKINTKWEQVVKKRNKIAHGKLIEASAQEARDAFEAVVRGILWVHLSLWEKR